ncbi:MAG: aminomethyl-transferring glycine dehydrogenase subunit GcvPA [Clostridiaceae bacterium]|nr:aminomethyl-transferring glycine dehydrogenase subunit GcvPA [Clostridiaceae bacterium]
MLEEVGKKSVEEIFDDIPASVRLKEKLDIPGPMPEMELVRHMEVLAAKNVNTGEYACFLGAGAYDHYVPGIIKHMLGRGEFYTAYTPYQPEISQGTLQAIFEYQTMICELTGMDVSNASMYDGATAAAEAILLACNLKKKKKALVSRSIHPETREVIRTYAAYNDIEIMEVSFSEEGITDEKDLEGKFTNDFAALIVQSPNFFGSIEDMDNMGRITKARDALFIAVVDPVSLAILKPPAEYGADIAVGEGQSLGNSLSFGGPYLGFFAATRELARRMPGRIVGQTTDTSGNRGFVLTLQAREQHIRREKATSNICTNQALNALAATIHLVVMGRRGLRDVANLCIQKTHYAYETLLGTGKFAPAFQAPFFKEFTLCVKDGNLSVSEINRRLLEEKIIGGYELGKKYENLKNAWLVAVTEKRTKEEIDRLAETIRNM